MLTDCRWPTARCIFTSLCSRQSENSILLLSIKAVPSVSSKWEPIVLFSAQSGWLPHHEPEGPFLHPSFCPVLHLPAKIHLLVLLSDYWSATIPWVDSMAQRALVDLGHIALRCAHTHSRISIQPRTIAFCLSSAVGVPVPRSVTAMPSYAVCCTGL